MCGEFQELLLQHSQGRMVSIERGGGGESGSSGSREGWVVVMMFAIILLRSGEAVEKQEMLLCSGGVPYGGQGSRQVQLSVGSSGSGREHLLPRMGAHHW